MTRRFFVACERIGIPESVVMMSYFSYSSNADRFRRVHDNRGRTTVLSENCGLNFVLRNGTDLLLRLYGKRESLNSPGISYFRNT